jgi:phage pi2 protein 07
MDLQQFIEQSESIFIERISYLEKESPGIYKKHLNKPEVPVIMAFLIMATSEDPNQKQIVHDYIDGIILIECGKIEEGKVFMEKGVQSLHDFSGSEIMHKNFINRYIYPKQKINEGNFTFDVKKSLSKFLKDKEVKLSSEGAFNVSLANLKKEIKEWVKEIDSLKSVESVISEPKIKLRNAATNGIVLYYLMKHGGFEWTLNTNNLTEYLKTLKIEGSGQQAYNKGIVHLGVDEERGKERKYNYFTKKEFASALEFLKEINNDAYDKAESDYASYLLDDQDPERGNFPKFFRK